MLTLPDSVALPLKQDPNGTIRVSDTRVTLHTIISAYRLGQGPEAIHASFPSVPLADVYAVIGYYLANREVVDAHMREVDAEGDRWQTFWEERNPPPSRAELEARREAKQRGDGDA